MQQAFSSGPLTVVLVQVFVVVLLLVGFQVAVSRIGSLSQEAKRRWQHALTGRALVAASYLLPIAVCIPCLYLAAFGIVYIRRFHPDLFLRSFGPLLRPHEKQDGQLPGAFYFVLGTALTATLFPLHIARYAVECLSISDPVAAWVGRTVPSPRIHESASLAGTAACFATAWLIGYLYLTSDGDTGLDAVPLGVISWGALACCVAEAFPMGNDNLLIPLATATAASLASQPWR